MNLKYLSCMSCCTVVRIEKIMLRFVNYRLKMAQAHTSIHEMLKDTPTMNESNTAIHSGSEPRLKHPNSLPLNHISGTSLNKLDGLNSYYNE